MSAELTNTVAASNAHMGRAGEVLLRQPGPGGGWLRLSRPEGTARADNVNDVLEVLRRVEEEAAGGRFAAGFISYGAAEAFDPALEARHDDDGPPLAWFGFYDPPGEPLRLPASPTAPGDAWNASITETQHAGAVARIRALIAAGDTYQVNYTHRLRASFAGDPWSLFAALAANCPPPFAACIDTGRHVICSLSPELFFELDGDRIVSRPMKGTAPRGLALEDDRARAQALQTSAKDRAENVMIVDMVRNDLGRIARPGTVRVPRLFEVEQYPGQWQMTSTVEGRTDAALTDIFRALFPAASVTGAPKKRTMEIIQEIEDSPRGVYTGAIGVAGPGRRARFSVAIRTAVADRATGTMAYGVGGGIVWDSTAEAEWRECATKAEALRRPLPAFDLLETLRWSAEDGGYALLDEHLRRLAGSAAYFDYPLQSETVRRRLEAAAAGWTGVRRVRLLAGPDGEIDITSVPMDPAPPHTPLRTALATRPVEAEDPFLYHKTTHRTVYERALREHPDCDDVILWNKRGELTESCLANLVLELDGVRYTPPVRCGLLAGTGRARLLREGGVRERVLYPEDLGRAARILLVNSVRGEREAVLRAGG